MRRRLAARLAAKVNGVGQFAGRTNGNNLVRIADFRAKADGCSILMVNGGLKAKPVELRPFGDSGLGLCRVRPMPTTRA
jgi:hypothetical protein